MPWTCPNQSWLEADCSAPVPLGRFGGFPEVRATLPASVEVRVEPWTLGCGKLASTPWSHSKDKEVAQRPNRRQAQWIA